MCADLVAEGTLDGRLIAIGMFHAVLGIAAAYIRYEKRDFLTFKSPLRQGLLVTLRHAVSSGVKEMNVMSKYTTGAEIIYLRKA